MPDDALRLTLISDTFFDGDGPSRLAEALAEAAGAGAHLAMLPELPLNPWSPAARDPRDDDAEPPEGPRWRAQAGAARRTGIALLGGVILRDPVTGARTNTALLFAPDGSLTYRYAKVHLPDEPGFHETCHYQPGTEPPRVIDALGLRLGVQICSDNNRPVGCHLLRALGCEVMLVPRATTRDHLDRWRASFQANAATTGMYVASVNRPRPERGVALAGPTLVYAPDGRLIAESDDRLVTVTMDRGAIEAARREYPAYLPYPAGLYAEAWRRAADA